jgi:hypothetical protein
VNDYVPIALLDDLSARECELIECARRGHMLVCSDPNCDALGNSDDPEHRVRAELIRELLLGRRGPLDPRGVQVVAARIIGPLDLLHVQAIAGLSSGTEIDRSSPADNGSGSSPDRPLWRRHNGRPPPCGFGQGGASTSLDVKIISEFRLAPTCITGTVEQISLPRRVSEYVGTQNGGTMYPPFMCNK